MCWHFKEIFLQSYCLKILQIYAFQPMLNSAGLYWQEKQAQLFDGGSPKHLTSYMIGKEMYLFSLPGFPSEC